VCFKECLFKVIHDLSLPIRYIHVVIPGKRRIVFIWDAPFIGFTRADVYPRIYEYKMQSARKYSDRIKFLTSSFGIGGDTIDKERTVAPYCKRYLLHLYGTYLQVEVPVNSFQETGCIGGTASEPGTHRYVFMEVYRQERYTIFLAQFL
jgi:hypothetical protein